MYQTKQSVKNRAAKTRTTATFSRIADGRAGVIATLKIMRDLIRAGKRSLPVRLLALDLTTSLPQKDFTGEISALYTFVRDRIRYVRDVRGIETLQTPEKTLELRAGDCDDKSILLASLLESIGHPTRLIAVGFRPGVFSHVYVQTRTGRKWVSLETTEPWKMGDEPPRIVDRLVMKV